MAIPVLAAASEQLALIGELGRGPAATLALFPANVLGKTFQWDTASGGHPTSTAANSQVLTPAQLVALGQILEGFGEVFDSMDAVFGPSVLVFK